MVIGVGGVRTVLRRGEAAEALDGNLESELGGLTREPGVRRQL
ncbi:MAG: hypothetical protein WKF40_10900 [Thermoleophilaceae bacterium]